MGQEAPFQFEAAPQQFYTTSYENEVAYVTPGSHQSTDFSEFQISQGYKSKQIYQERMPIGDGLGFMASLVILWQAVKFIQKKTRKILPIVIFILFFNNLSARDVVWKYSFMSETFTMTDNINYQTLSLCGRNIKMANSCVSKSTSNNQWNASFAAKCSFVRGLGMKISPTFFNYTYVDFLDTYGLESVKTITLHFTYPASTNIITSDIYLQEYSTAYDEEIETSKTKTEKNRQSYAKTNPIGHNTISYGDTMVIFNVNRSLTTGWILHFELNDIFYLREIEIEYEINGDDNPDIDKPCHKFYSNGVLTHQFVDHLGNVDYLAGGYLMSEAIENNDWKFAGWSPTNDYYDAAACTPITALASGTAAQDIEYHAIYEHRRPEENPVDVDSASRYYSLYSDVCPAIDENGYETNSDVTFPDGVRYKMSIDASRFYYFSLPYDCPLSYITFSNPAIQTYVTGISDNAYVGDWLITRWDEATYNWVDIMNVDLATTVLTAGVGYGIGIVPNVNTDVYFHSDYNQKVTPLHNDTIPISFTYPVQDDNTGCHSGWNFLGSRFYQPINYTTLNTSYVLIANENDLGWTLHCKYGENNDSGYDIAPFSAFMVQTDRDLTYSMDKLQAVAAEYSENHFNLVIKQDDDAERMDYTTIVSGAEYSDKYEIGMDIGKMLVQDDKPQIYSVMDSLYYAINASGFGIGSKIKVGIYVPHKENWVVALGKNIDIPEGWHIILKDNSTGAKTDLTVEDYQFNLRKGLYSNRFEVEISDMPLGVNDVSVDSICEPEWMRIVSLGGIVVYEGEFDLDRLEGLTEGIYVVQTDVWTRKMMVKR